MRRRQIVELIDIEERIQIITFYVVFILVCTENMSTQFFFDKFFKFMSSSCGDLKIGLSCVLLVQFKTPCTID